MLRGFVLVGKMRDVLTALQALAELESEMSNLRAVMDGKVVRISEEEEG